MTLDHLYIFGPESAGNHLVRDVACFLLGVSPPDCMGFWAIADPLPERQHPAVWAGSVPSAARWDWPSEVRERLVNPTHEAAIVIRRAWPPLAQSLVDRRWADDTYAALLAIRRAEEVIAKFISTHNLPYYVVQYEGLCEAPQMVMDHLARFLGVLRRGVEEFPAEIVSGNPARWDQLREARG